MTDYLFYKYQCDLTEQSAGVSSDPEKYQKWLDTLSLGRAQLCAEQLLQSMNSLNRIEIDPAVRQKLLFQYLRKVHELSPRLEMELERPEGLGHEIARRAVSVLVQLYYALFNGIRITLVQRLKKPPLLNREQQKIELLNRVLHAAKEVMTIAGRYHVIVPTPLWLYCHELYQYILKEKLYDKIHKNGLPLQELYIQILLIGMIPQSRMNMDSFDWLCQNLLPYSSTVKILTTKQPIQKPNGFYIDIRTDDPPRFFSRTPTNDKTFWYRIDCQYLIDKFTEIIENKDAEGKAYNDDVMLMRLITIEWSYSARRRLPRNKVNKPIWFQSKMGSVWELLQNSSWRPGDILEGGRFATHPSLMTQVDNSENGLGITGDPQGTCIQIGEIALTRGESDQNWMLGVIRWVMLNGSGQNINCGIEYLTKEAKAVEVKPVIGAGSNYFTPALQLPANPKQGKGMTLVLTGRVYSRLREFIINDLNGNERAVRLSRLTTQTAFYQLAEFLDSDDL